MGGSGAEMYVNTADPVVNRIWDPTLEILYYKITSTSTTRKMHVWLGTLTQPKDVSVDTNIFGANVPAVWTYDSALNMVVVNVQGDIIVDFLGNLKASNGGPIGYVLPSPSYQQIPPSSGQQVGPSPPSFTFPDVLGILGGYLSALLAFGLSTMPWSLAFPLVLLVALAFVLTKPVRGRGRGLNSPGSGQVVVVERGKGPNVLVTLLSLSLGAVVTGLSMAYVFPAMGWLPKPTVPYQVLVLLFFVIALAAFLLSYVAVMQLKSRPGRLE